MYKDKMVTVHAIKPYVGVEALSMSELDGELC